MGLEVECGVTPDRRITLIIVIHSLRYWVCETRHIQELRLIGRRGSWRINIGFGVRIRMGDGGYSGNNRSKSYGSMTVAGVASLSITSSFLMDEVEQDGAGDPICCGPVKEDPALERGVNWLAKHFSTRSNPSSKMFWLYYMYGLERAGRMSGRRFFGNHDWYRAGVRTLLQTQSPRTGGWKGGGPLESNSTLSTSYALLFLSKGLSPVVINKAKFGPPRCQQSASGAWEYVE